MNKIILCGVAVAALAAATSAQAQTISAQVLNPNNVAPFTLQDLSGEAPAGQSPGLQSTASFISDNISVSFNNVGGPPLAGVYQGNVSGIAASPYNNDGYNVATTNNGNYLVSQDNNSTTLTFAHAQTAFDLLWGTVDNYNLVDLQFLVGGTTITGTQVAQAAANAGYSVNYGSSQLAVEITGLKKFNTVTVIDNQQPAFEFVPGVPVTGNVPEPATFAVLGAGLVALGLVRRRG